MCYSIAYLAYFITNITARLTETEAEEVPRVRGESGGNKIGTSEMIWLSIFWKTVRYKKLSISP
jgi:hypothetical protein